MPGLLAHDFWMHRAAVDDRTVAFWGAHVHLGHEAERFVRIRVKVRRDPLALGRHVGVRSQHAELLGERWLGLLVTNSD
jgi:hypothetical protein